MVTPRQTIDSMKRVQEILRHCQDDPWVRKRVAQETAQWVRNGKQKPFEEFLAAIEERLKIKRKEDVKNEGPTTDTIADNNHQEGGRGGSGRGKARAPSRRARGGSDPSKP